MLLCVAGSLAALEDSQNALTSLGRSLATAPPVQLAATNVMVPGEFLRSALQDAAQYQINQLAFADKVRTSACTKQICHGQMRLPFFFW